MVSSFCCYIPSLPQRRVEEAFPQFQMKKHFLSFQLETEEMLLQLHFMMAIEQRK